MPSRATIPHLTPVSTAKRPREHDRVRLVRAVTDQEGVYEAGSTGAIVHVYEDGDAYEVELTNPTHAVVTVDVGDVEHLPG